MRPHLTHAQVQIADFVAGGANPAIRTLFYRLVRLLSLTITPIFVFDGPNKPAFKRGKRSRGPGDTVSVAMAKRLFKLFGFAIHDAPGEAEAECALLQQQEVVDAVLSEDVDTIMFGCTRTLRNWSAEGSRTAKTPTHVSLYDVAELRQGETGLDREGMVLVALMSGGDYIPEGVPGCGVKVACEAAKAGFGKRLCRIKRSDTAALQEWREELIRELRTNESRFFRVKHKALTIPGNFPDVEILRYYTHPVVSQTTTVERLRKDFPSKQEIDIVGLRDFAAETFDWTFKIGAIKFIRVFAPGLLVQGLMNLSSQELVSDDPDARAEVESKLVKSIKSTRVHFSTDATPELRMSFIPADVVRVDLDAEEDEITSTYGRSGLALNSDNEEEDQREDEEGQSKSGPKKVFDPLQPDLTWIPETVAKLGVPLLVEDWEARQRNKEAAKQKKGLEARLSRRKASDMPAGALDKYVKITKPSGTAICKEPETPATFFSGSQSSPPLRSSSRQVRERGTASAARETERSAIESTRRTQFKASMGKGKASSSRASLDTNPWSIASSQATPKASRTKSNDKAKKPIDTILISSSPTAPSPHSPTAPMANNLKMQNTQSSVLSPTDDNSQRPCFISERFSPASSPATIEFSADATLGPRKHNHSPLETTKPTAKRPQRARAARDSSPARKVTRAGRAAVQNAAQPSIKTFGRVSEAMGKKDAAPASTKASSTSFDCDPNSDNLEDLCSIGAKGSRHSKQFPGPSAKSPAYRAPINIPSSPPSVPSPWPSEFASKMTRVYIPRTSDAGLGYVREVQVTRDEADRMMREEAECSRGAKRPGGRRMWRESEMSIVDLTGDD